jgi:hypothetical protein
MHQLLRYTFKLHVEIGLLREKFPLDLKNREKPYAFQTGDARDIPVGSDFEIEEVKRARVEPRMKGFKRDLQVPPSSSAKTHLHPCNLSHTPRAQLNQLPFPPKNVANTGQPSQNHHHQSDKTDQAGNVKHLHCSVEFLPFGHRTPSSFPKNLELFPALLAFFVVNLYCADCKQAAYPGHDGVEGPLRFYIFARAFWAFYW